MSSRVFYSLSTIAAICLLLQLPSNSAASRILGFFPSPSKSHLLIHCSIAAELSEAGHDVTVIGSVPNVYKQAKYKYIQVETPSFDPAFTSDMINKPQPMYKHMVNFIPMLGQMANESLSHPTTQQFLRENGENSFDLVILGYFMNDLHLGLGAHFKCPVILSFMIQPIPFVNSLVGNPNEISYVPTLIGGLKQPMSFRERVLNYLIDFVEFNIMRILFESSVEKYYKHHFPADRYPSLDEMRKNVSLVLCNHHFSQGPIRPQVPGIVEIGGIQIKEKPDPLPADIAEVLDNSKEGVIYFSLGSNVQGSVLSKEKAKIMFDVLSKLPFKVLWKWGDSGFPGTSKNIIYKSWLPQDDILAHPNVKVFITHGGQGSVVESQYHGVPMVVIPLFGDQPANMANVERSGFGVGVSYIDMTEESFRKDILKVLLNSKYATAVKTFSKLYRDRPMTARQTAVYWVEYVLRHHGAKHLQSPAVFMNRWQLMSLDVIGFLVAIIALVVFIFVKICKFLCCRGKGAKKASDKVTKTKKNK